MNKILVIRLSAIGDVLFTLPAVKAMADAKPGCAISWIVEDKAAAILQHRRDLDEVIVYPRGQIRRRLRNPLLWPSLLGLIIGYIRRIRRQRYDACFDFQGNLKSGVHAFLARSGRKIGFAKGYVKEMSHVFYNETVVPPGHAVHREEKAYALAFPGYEPGDIRRPDLQIPPEAAAAAGRLVSVAFPQNAAIARNEGFCVLHPGTSAFGAFKRWPAERFGLLAIRLHESFGLQSLITWGPGERDLAERAAAASEGKAAVSPPTGSLLELAGVIERSVLFVAADSGPLHLANFQGIPCVALFGPKDPEIYKPYFQPSAVVRNPPPCCPCSKRECDDPVCMADIDVEMVFDAARELLKKS